MQPSMSQSDSRKPRIAITSGDASGTLAGVQLLHRAAEQQLGLQMLRQGPVATGRAGPRAARLLRKKSRICPQDSTLACAFPVREPP